MRSDLGLIRKLHVLLALARYGMQDDSTVNYFIFAWHQLWHSGRGRPSISWCCGFESLLFFSFFFLSFFLFPSCPKSGLKRSWIYKQGKRYSIFNPQLCCLGSNNQLWRKKGWGLKLESHGWCLSERMPCTTEPDILILHKRTIFILSWNHFMVKFLTTPQDQLKVTEPRIKPKIYWNRIHWKKCSTRQEFSKTEIASGSWKKGRLRRLVKRRPKKD